MNSRRANGNTWRRTALVLNPLVHKRFHPSIVGPLLTSAHVYHVSSAHSSRMDRYLSSSLARLGLRSRQVDLDDEDYGRRQALNAPNHQPTRPVDKERAEADLALSIKKATSPEESAPSKQRAFPR
jgi:hypothetical protein